MKSGLRRAITSIGIASISGCLLFGGGTAEAHPGDGHETDEQHAVQDLAGVPMTTIESATRANAAKIKKSTGAVPGRRTAQQQVAAQRVAATADPGQSGQWSAVQDTPVVPVFQAVLPNGKVLMWDSVGDKATGNYPDHTFTRAIVWDPQTDTYHQVNVSGYNIFCAGYAQLADGRVLVAGGNKNPQQDGIVQTHIFDWRTETWSRGPDMNAARWYPGVAALSNGEALIVAGGPATAEVYQTNGALRRLTGFSSFARRSYPFLVPRPDGKVELVGPDNRMDTMSTTGAGALTATRTRDGIGRTLRRLRHLRHRQGAGGRWRQHHRGRPDDGPHPNRLDRGRRRLGDPGAPHGLDVGRTPDVGPHPVGGRQCPGHGRAESDRGTGWSTWTIRSSPPSAGTRRPRAGPSSPVPTESGSTIPRPPCCRTAG